VGLKAVDERGREVVARQLVPWDGRRSDLVFHLDLPTETRQADLTFAVHRSRFVEFRVKPAAAR
jgi:hypothetical protein